MVYLPQLNMINILKRALRNWPENSAVASPEKNITYRELDVRVQNLAAALAQSGIQKGDVVAFLAENRPEFIELLFAMAHIGGILLPLNYRLNSDELVYILNDSGAKGILYSPAFESVKEEIVPQVSSIELTWKLGISEYEMHLDMGDLQNSKEEIVRFEDPLVLMYTSGTTGKPKGCLQSHRALLATIGNYNNTFGKENAEVHLVAMPLFHVGGLGSAVSTLGTGGTIITCPKVDYELMFQLIEQYKVTSLLLLPPTLKQFASAPSRTKYHLDSLEVVLGGAGMESSETIRLVKENLDVSYFGMYGQTEAAGIIVAAEEFEIMDRPNNYGHELLNYNVRIVDENDQDVQPGIPGELILQGPTIMLGYLNNREATEKVVYNGWYHTGDVFIRETDGSLTMVDRKKYLIKTGGENVYPSEVELPLRQHPNVDDVCVAGLPDETWGEKVVAFLVLKSNEKPNDDELKSWCRKYIAGYKIPKQFIYVEEIPRNHSGKVLRDHVVMNAQVK
jgi:fatty-acyl-CoA synthase